MLYTAKLLSRDFYQIIMLITVINDAAVSISGSVLVEAQLSYPPSIYLRTYSYIAVNIMISLSSAVLVESTSY